MSAAVAALIDVVGYIGQAGADALAGAVVSDAYTGIKKRIVRVLRSPEASALPSEARQPVPAATSDALLEYVRRQDRALETILQLLDRVSRPEAPSGKPRERTVAAPVANPLLVGVGVVRVADQGAALSLDRVQSIVNDRDQGFPQTTKSVFALSHLCQGNYNLAEILARSALDVNPAEARSFYTLALAEWRVPGAYLSSTAADRIERLLATSAEAGLAPQCARPRAALRYDHYQYHRRADRPPSIRDLCSLHTSHIADARSWPYGLLNERVPVSARFRVVWGGR